MALLLSHLQLLKRACYLSSRCNDGDDGKDVSGKVESRSGHQEEDERKCPGSNRKRDFCVKYLGTTDVDLNLVQIKLQIIFVKRLLWETPRF
jgi:hypothetical protein